MGIYWGCERQIGTVSAVAKKRLFQSLSHYLTDFGGAIVADSEPWFCAKTALVSNPTRKTLCNPFGIAMVLAHNSG